MCWQWSFDFFQQQKFLIQKSSLLCWLDAFGFTYYALKYAGIIGLSLHVYTVPELNNYS